MGRFHEMARCRKPAYLGVNVAEIVVAYWSFPILGWLVRPSESTQQNVTQKSLHSGLSYIYIFGLFLFVSLFLVIPRV
jgi:hypothetical protein